MLSQADSDKISAQLESIEAELRSIASRMKVLSADLAKIREKIL